MDDPTITVHDKPQAPGESPKVSESLTRLIDAAFEQERRRDGQDIGPRPIALADGIPGYSIVREIHRGGQGVVFEAIQVSTRRTVAVKVMLEGRFASERSRWRFEQEARLIARLRHPNIVVVFDSGIADGLYYYAMDYVRGQPLDTHVRLSNLSIRQVVDLLVQVCEAVGYAHRRGVIHRDLKPSNVLVGEDGHPQVLDFGLAKLTRQDEEGKVGPAMTLTGHIIGTLRYMSPEQTLADPDAVDTRTDVYALGVMVYELLVGEPPYPTGVDLAAALRTIREVDPPRPSRLRRELGSELDAVILKTIQKDPDRRYRSASELGADLKAWLEGRPVTARSDSALYVLRKLAARHYFHTSVIVATLAAILGFGGVSYHALQQEREARRSEQLAQSSAMAAHKDMNTLMDDVQQMAQQYAVGWLLLEWQNGRTERAREILSELDSDSPEHAAMCYLLGSGLEKDELKRRLLPEAAALYHFVLGERCRVEGASQQARECFEACLAAPGDRYPWFRRSAAARLSQFEAAPAP